MVKAFAPFRVFRAFCGQKLLNHHTKSTKVRVARIKRSGIRGLLRKRRTEQQSVLSAPLRLGEIKEKRLMITPRRKDRGEDRVKKATLSTPSAPPRVIAFLAFSLQLSESGPGFRFALSRLQLFVACKERSGLRGMRLITILSKRRQAPG
jgi:hypothetical protein